MHFTDRRPGCLNNSLFMVGEIGRNDYNFAFLQGKTFEEAQNMVPGVIEIIKNAVRVSFWCKMFLVIYFID